MSFIIGDIKSNEQEPLEVGVLPAIVVGLTSYGIQPQTDWKTKEPKPSENRLAFTFEFPTELMTYKDDKDMEVSKPRWLTKEMKVSSHAESNLMKLVMALSPSLKNLSDLVGENCSVTIGRTSTGKAKITAIARLVKGMPEAKLHDKSFTFDFYEPTEEGFKDLTSFQQKIILGADDYNGFANEWVSEELLPAEDSKDDDDY